MWRILLEIVSLMNYHLKRFIRVMSSQLLAGWTFVLEETTWVGVYKWIFIWTSKLFIFWTVTIHSVSYVIEECKKLKVFKERIFLLVFLNMSNEPLHNALPVYQMQVYIKV